MPQYDAYEDPIEMDSPKLPAGEKKSTVSEGAAAKPLTSVHEGEHREKDGCYHADHQNDPFHSQMAFQFHHRHSHLDREGKVVESVASPEPEEAWSSPKKLSEQEKRDLAESEQSQQEDDSIRMMLASNAAEKDENKEEDAPDQFKKEAAMLNGGWMHRSRGSAELLSERPCFNHGLMALGGSGRRDCECSKI